MDSKPLNTLQQDDHPVLVKGSSDDRARQEFVKSLKTHIQQNLLPAVSSAYFPVSYTHLRAHETREDLVCRLLLE